MKLLLFSIFTIISLISTHCIAQVQYTVDTVFFEENTVKSCLPDADLTSRVYLSNLTDSTTYHRVYLSKGSYHFSLSEKNMVGIGLPTQIDIISENGSVIATNFVGNKYYHGFLFSIENDCQIMIKASFNSFRVVIRVSICRRKSP